MTPFGLSGSSHANATLCLVISFAWIRAIWDGAAKHKGGKKMLRQLPEPTQALNVVGLPYTYLALGILAPQMGY